MPPTQQPQQPKTGDPKALADAISRQNAPTNPVVQHLQRQVANGFVLWTNYKHYHWQTFGPHFRDLHELFDELAEATEGTIDDFAERVRMIGQDPVASPLELVRLATVKIADKTGDVRSMIDEADTNLLGVIRDMRAAIEVAEDAGDPGTADVFTRIVQIHEKHEWFLRELLREGDGLRH